MFLDEIQCHIPYTLYNEYKTELIVGAVIIVKQPAVLTLNFGQTHYLVLTKNNLIQIYYYSEKNHVKCIKLQNFFIDTIDSKKTDNKFHFKMPKNVTVVEEKKIDNEEKFVSQCSQIVISSQNPVHEKILQTVFDGVDADSFFDDF